MEAFFLLIILLKSLFNRSLFTRTIESQWNIYCERKFYLRIAQYTMMLGIVVGNFLVGILADRFGRKWPLTISIVIQLTFGVLCAVSPWFESFLAFRALIGIATGGSMCTSFVLIMEYVGLKWRTLVGILYQLPFCLGHMLLGVIAYSFRDWRIMQVAITIPSVFLLLYVFFIPESPRWLVMKGRLDEAIAVLENAAMYNSISIAPIRAKIERYAAERGFEQSNALSLVTTPGIRRNFILVSVCWLSWGFCYFGLNEFIPVIQNASIFIVIILCGIAQIPGCLFAVWSTHALGRKLTLIISIILSIIPCLILVFSYIKLEWLKFFVGLISMFGLMLQYSLLHIYTGELFPTVIRNAAIGLTIMISNMGAMVSPFILLLPNLEFYGPLIFAGAQFVALVCAVFIPETSHLKLPDTIEEAKENLRKKTEDMKKRSHHLMEVMKLPDRDNHVMRKIKETAKKEDRNLKNKYQFDDTASNFSWFISDNQKHEKKRRLCDTDTLIHKSSIAPPPASKLDELRSKRCSVSGKSVFTAGDPMRKNMRIAKYMNVPAPNKPTSKCLSIDENYSPKDSVINSARRPSKAQKNNVDSDDSDENETAPSTEKD